MKTARRPKTVRQAAQHAAQSTLVVPPEFVGTANPRHLRALAALLRRPMPREHLDRAAGASNGPDLIAELRRRGLDVPCERVPVPDRDGHEVRRGIYRLTARDRRMLAAWQRDTGRSLPSVTPDLFGGDGGVS